MKVYIGTSGWFYFHWIGKFYPNKMTSGEYLKFYSSHFNTVEINSTFYRIPKQTTIKNWIRNVGSDFVFSIKVNREVTHSGKFSREKLLNFISNFELIGDRIEFYLLQFPPSFKYSKENLLEISNIRDIDKISIEFRDNSWLKSEVLEEIGNEVNIVYSDYDKLNRVLRPSNGKLYVRLHGANGRYKGEYGEKIIDYIREFFSYRDGFEKLFIYFNNDYGGAAPSDAKIAIQAIRDYQGIS